MKSKYLLCFLFLGAWLLSTNYPALGARIAGEEGVTSVTPPVAKKAPGPVAKKPVPKQPAPSPSKKEPALKEKPAPETKVDPKENRIQNPRTRSTNM